MSNSLRPWGGPRLHMRPRHYLARCRSAYRPCTHQCLRAGRAAVADHHFSGRADPPPPAPADELLDELAEVLATVLDEPPPPASPVPGSQVHGEYASPLASHACAPYEPLVHAHAICWPGTQT